MYLHNLVREYVTNYRGGLCPKGEGQLSAQQFQTLYRKISGLLENAAVTKQTVGILLEHGHEYLLTMCACLERGVAYVPLNKKWPAARVEEVVELTEISLIIDDTAIRSAGDSQTTKVNFTAKPEDTAYIICTSGSTGKPKGVAIPRSALENFFRWLNRYFAAVSSQDCILAITDFSFDLSLLDVGLLLTRRPNIHFSGFNTTANIFTLARDIQRQEATILCTVPNNIAMLLHPDVLGRTTLASLRYLLLGGARFAYGTYTSIFGKLFPTPQVYNFYGPTEATVYCHVKALTGNEALDTVHNNISIGKPIDGMQCFLLDTQDRKISEPHQIGSLFLSGKQLMKEYVASPQKTAEVIRFIQNERCYDSGDLSFFDEQGDFYIVGRKDETLKRRGFRINLLDIDSYIQKLDCVLDSCTVAIPSEQFENVLISYIVPKSQISSQELLSRLKSILVDYQIPDAIIFTDTFPLNNSGKVNRDALRQLYLNSQAAHGASH